MHFGPLRLDMLIFVLRLFHELEILSVRKFHRWKRRMCSTNLANQTILFLCNRLWEKKVNKLKCFSYSKYYLVKIFHNGSQTWCLFICPSLELLEAEYSSSVIETWDKISAAWNWTSWMTSFITELWIWPISLLVCAPLSDSKW